MVKVVDLKWVEDIIVLDVWNVFLLVDYFMICLVNSEC